MILYLNFSSCSCGLACENGCSGSCSSQSCKNSCDNDNCYGGCTELCYKSCDGNCYKGCDGGCGSGLDNYKIKRKWSTKLHFLFIFHYFQNLHHGFCL